MQMLHAMGVPCVGFWPAFEPPVIDRPLTAADIAPMRGFAMKRLDIHRIGLPGQDTRTIWLDRSVTHQTASMRKFSRILEDNDPQPNRFARKRWEASLRQHRAKCIMEIGKRPLLLLSFENLLSAPGTAAALMVDFIGLAPADTSKAVACVQKRVLGAHCEPGLDIEHRLSEVANQETTQA